MTSDLLHAEKRLKGLKLRAVLTTAVGVGVALVLAAAAAHRGLDSEGVDHLIWAAFWFVVTAGTLRQAAADAKRLGGSLLN